MRITYTQYHSDTMDENDAIEWELDDTEMAASSSSSSSSSSSYRRNMDPESVCTNNAPELVSMKTLVQRFPHMITCTHSDSTDPKLKSVATTAAMLATAIRAESSDSATAAMVASSQVDPWQSREWHRARSELHIPEFFVKSSPNTQLSQADINDLLRRKQHKMCIQSSDLESSLLVESGSWIANGEKHKRTYPACSKGAACVGMQSAYWIRNQRKGIIWTAMMYDYEWNDFESSGVYNGEPRMCVMDHRKLLPALVAKQRLMNMKGVKQENDVTLSDTTQGDSIRIRQAYYNLIDCAGGYHKQYIFLAEPGEAMLEPIVRLNSSTMVATRFPSGQMYADQSQMVYGDWSAVASAAGPIAGENMANF